MKYDNVNKKISLEQSVEVVFPLETKQKIEELLSEKQ
jgi:hypothetical protein